MLTTLVKRQLVIFAVLASLALIFTSVTYARVPKLLGIGTYSVSADFRDISGLYPSAIVTYRGFDVGTVEAVELEGSGVRVTMDLERGTSIPASSNVEVRSTSAIGEQYLDLVPDSKAGPFLDEGDVIARGSTREMLQITPVLEELDSLLKSVPTKATKNLLDQVDEGLGGRADELASIIDDTSSLVDAAQDSLESTTSLVEAASPLLQTQQQLADQTRSYAGSLKTFTRTLTGSDADVRKLIASSPPVDELTKTVDVISPSLPVLLANTATISEVLNVYTLSLTSTLSIYPALMARLQGVLYDRVKQGEGHLDIKATFNDPQPCITGYYSVDERRQPSDTSYRPGKTAYCDKPAAAPEVVRGTRNLPCVNDPSRRGPRSASCGLVFDGATTSAGTSSALLEAAGTLQSSDTADSTSAEREEDEPWMTLLTSPLQQ
jgi:phospholipid/cholesterol/gamma-HCH transport system substrate-binding protein